MTKNAYLKPGRLQDVLALIQVLALDEQTHRSLEGIRKELQGNPFSSDSWLSLAKEHPEFFRVRPEGVHVLSLSARHVLPHEEDILWPTLPPDFETALLQTAINLHDRQISKAERWKHLWPPVITGVLVIISVIVSVLLTARAVHPAQTNRFVNTEVFGVLVDTSKGQLCWALSRPKPASIAD